MADLVDEFEVLILYMTRASEQDGSNGNLKQSPWQAVATISVTYVLVSTRAGLSQAMKTRPSSFSTYNCRGEQ